MLLTFKTDVIIKHQAWIKNNFQLTSLHCSQFAKLHEHRKITKFNDIYSIKLKRDVNATKNCVKAHNLHHQFVHISQNHTTSCQGPYFKDVRNRGEVIQLLLFIFSCKRPKYSGKKVIKFCGHSLWVAPEHITKQINK